jgi:elongation factor G
VDPESGQTLIMGMGELHLEIIASRIAREYGLKVHTGKPQVSYRESINRESTGSGEFIRIIQGRGHFGHAVLRLFPIHSGIEFVNALGSGVLLSQFASAVEKGVMGAVGGGPLAGFPLDGLRIELVEARIHETDSSETGYSYAGAMALRDALEQAGTILREPLMRLDIICPPDYLGEIIGDVNSRRGTVTGMEPRGEVQTIRARVPLAELFGYSTALRSLSQGRAGFSMQFLDYAEVGENVARGLLEQMGIAGLGSSSRYKS